MEKAFDNSLYLKIQSENILKRMETFGEKLYLEFGGKLFDDYHASRVLPGFKSDAKLQILLKIKNKVEIVIVINAFDIENSKARADIGVKYENEVLRLIDAFRDVNLLVGSVCITRYHSTPAVDKYILKLNNLGIKTYKHYAINGYPSDIENIISENGFGKNEYIETTKPVVVVTAPGPGSGKMATCLSQLYHENKRSIKAGYAKYETFPIWNLPLNHPVNLAYEAATIDLADVNMIDPYHLENYGKLTVNYNRDVEIFPVLKSLFIAINGSCPYKSPTDMGVNAAGLAIINDEVAQKASKQEIIRRYLQAKVDLLNSKITPSALDKAKLLMKKANLSVEDRPCYLASLKKKEETGKESMAMELSDGTIITGKDSNLLLAPAALLLNALKHLAKISDEFDLLPKSVIEPISKMKVEVLHKHNPKLHLDEVLSALSISASTNPLAELALKKIAKLEYSEAHSTVILSSNDLDIFKKLKINVTTEPEYYARRIYHK